MPSNLQPLRPGDVIAIVAPASALKPERVDRAVATLRAMGYVPRLYGDVKGVSGSFSAPVDDRYTAMRDALADPQAKAILCGRGGYGCVHLIDSLYSEITSHPALYNPKWVIGFSDVTALHALWHRLGWPSAHASMSKHLAEYGADDPLTARLFALLAGENQCVGLPCGVSGSPHARNRCGEVTAEIVGGNVAVWGGLLGTPFNPIHPGCILVIEDIAEPIYKIERILYQLQLSGLLAQIGGLVVGQFTDYRHPTADHEDVYQMINRLLDRLGIRIPVAMDVPVGHLDSNIPLLLNATATLTVTPKDALLTYRPILST